jgi:site-specific DNA recombinase
LTGGRARARHDVVRRIERERRAGKTLRQIARDLESDGVPTSRGGKWTHSSVAYVLAQSG